MREILIWGCGGHGREVAYLCGFLDVDILGFIDDRPDWKGKIIDGIPVLGRLENLGLLRENIEIVASGVGDPSLKRQFHQRIIDCGHRLAKPLIHPRVFVGKRVTIGDGSILCEGVILTTNVQIGSCVILNRAVNISHDCRINDYATVSPGANISGEVIICEGAYIGTGATIREKIEIGEWSIVGGGAFVRDNVAPETMVAGVPAIKKKNNRKGEVWLSKG